MRNGIYRIWLKGSNGGTAGAVVLKDGDILACHRSHAFVGLYTECGGQLRAEVRCKRLNDAAKPVNLPDLDDYYLHAEGACGEEFATLTCTVPEHPGFNMCFEMTWHSHA